MKPETLIYDQIRKITPEKSSRNIFLQLLLRQAMKYSFIPI